MAIVIHNIKGNAYAYDHHREGAKVVAKYIGPVGAKDTKDSYTTREPIHGGGRPTYEKQSDKPQTGEVTQHKEKPIPDTPRIQKYKEKGYKFKNIYVLGRSDGNSIGSTELNIQQMQELRKAGFEYNGAMWYSYEQTQIPIKTKNTMILRNELEMKSDDNVFYRTYEWAEKPIK